MKIVKRGSVTELGAGDRFKFGVGHSTWAVVEALAVDSDGAMKVRAKIVETADGYEFLNLTGGKAIELSIRPAAIQCIERAGG